MGTRKMLSASLRIGLLCALLVSVSISAVRAVECIDYSGYIHRVGTAALPFSPYDVDVQGSHVFVTGYDGLLVLDRTDPGNPRIVAELPLPFASSIALGDEIACLVGQDSPFQLVNISDPEAPWLEAILPLPTRAWQVELDGSFAYVAGDTMGLLRIDVSDPEQLSISAVYGTPGRALDVALHDGYAYIADRNGLRVIDLSNPVSPGQPELDRPGPYLFSIAVTDGRAYLLDENFGIHFYDISDPLDPIFIERVNHGGSGELAIVGDLLYAGTGPGLELFDISNGRPQYLGGIAVGIELTRGLAVDGELVYLGSWDSQLDVVDVSSPRNPEPVGSTYVAGWTHQTAIAGTHAFIACEGAGLRIVDVSDPFAPVELGAASLLGYAEHVEVESGIAYVATRHLGFEILDVTKPEAPFYLGGITTDERTRCVALTDGYAFVAADAELLVVDISDPAAPWQVTALPMPSGAAVHVSLAGDLLVVAAEGWLHAVDVSDPTLPFTLSSAPAWATVVELRGELAYVVGEQGLQVFSVEDPKRMELQGSLILPGWPHDISLQGDVAYVAAYGGGLQLVGIADPASPRSLGSTVVWAQGVTVAGTCAYVVESARLSIFPLHCDLTGLSEPGLGWQAAAPNRPRMLPNHPNPFGPLTTLAFSLPEAGRVKVTIHDPRGRLLRSFPEMRLGSGTHELHWDGRDSAGRALPAGVYWARLKSNGVTEGIKLTLLR